jgi:hypothetical protein
MLKKLFWIVIVPALAIAAYFAVVLRWNYSSGERAGWVQKLSKKGWLCKTWEGEMAMVSLPGTTPEKFPFTVWDDKVASDINKVIGKRVALHYEQKVGLPTSCFGETRYYVTQVTAVEDIPLAPGIVVPTQPPATGTGAPSAAPSTPPAVPSQPVPAQPVPTQPAPAQPAPVQPSTTQPSAPQPSAQPAPTQPAPALPPAAPAPAPTK